MAGRRTPPDRRLPLRGPGFCLHDVGPYFLTEAAITLLFPVIGLYALYWVVRLGLRHGLPDVVTLDISAVHKPGGPALLHGADLRA